MSLPCPQASKLACCCFRDPGRRHETAGASGQRTYLWHSKQGEQFLLPADFAGAMWRSRDGCSASSGFMLHLRNTELGESIALK